MLPVNVHDPPALSVIEKLNVVDAAHKRFGIVFVVARLINAPDMGDVAKLFGAPRNLLFVESKMKMASVLTFDINKEVIRLRLRLGGQP